MFDGERKPTVKGDCKSVSGCVVGGEGECILEGDAARVSKSGSMGGGEGERIAKDAARVSRCVVGGVMGRVMGRTLVSVMCGFGTSLISVWSICIGSMLDLSLSEKLPGMFGRLSAIESSPCGICSSSGVQSLSSIRSSSDMGSSCNICLPLPLGALREKKLARKLIVRLPFITSP